MEMACCHVGVSEGALKVTLVALANAAAAPASMKDLRVTKVASYRRFYWPHRSGLRTLPRVAGGGSLIS
jgi:hypothetical protein